MTKINAGRARRRRLTGAVALLLWLSAAAASAQGLGFLSGSPDPGASETVERQDVVTTVTASTTQARAARLVEAEQRAAADGVELDGGELIGDARRRYLDAVGRELGRLQGDGVLTLAEVSENLPPLRDRALDRFDDVVSARSRGFAPPPLREEYDSVYRYALEITRYTLVTRNGWPAWLALLLSVAGGALFAALLSRALVTLNRHIDHDKRSLTARAVSGVRLPLYLTAVAAGLLVGLEWLWLPRGVREVLNATLAILVTALLFWAAWRLCNEATILLVGALERLTDKSLHGQGELIIKRLLHVLVVIAFALVVTKFVLDASLTGLIAGLGVVGVGLWFLMHGLIENLSASFTLFGDRPFGIGDIIIYDGVWVTVEDIGFRSTRLRTFDGHLLTVPNAALVDDAIHNVSARPYIRRRFRLSLTYNTPPDKVEEALAIVREVLDERADSFPDDQPPHAVFDNFGAYDLQLLIQYYYKQPDYWAALEFDGEVNRALLRRFNDAGIDFAFPTQTTVLETEQREPPRLRLIGGDEASAGEDADDNGKGASARAASAED